MNKLMISREVFEEGNYQIDVTKHGVFLTKIAPIETHELGEYQQAYLHIGDVIKAINQKNWYVEIRGINPIPEGLF